MFNGNTDTMALFEHPLNEFKSVQVTRLVHDFYDSDPKRGFYGGAASTRGSSATRSSSPSGGAAARRADLGRDYKRLLGEYFNRTMCVAGHTTSLPVEANSVTLDPTLKDDWGLPALRVTYKDHDDDLKMMQFMVDRSKEIAEAAGAQKVWAQPVQISGAPPTCSAPAGWATTQDLRREHRPPDPRRAELVPLRRRQHGHLGPRPAHDDDHGAGVPGGERIAGLAKRGEI